MASITIFSSSHAWLLQQPLWLRAILIPETILKDREAPNPMFEFQMLCPSLLSLGGVSISSEQSNLGNLYEKRKKASWIHKTVISRCPEFLDQWLTQPEKRTSCLYLASAPQLHSYAPRDALFTARSWFDSVNIYRKVFCSLLCTDLEWAWGQESLKNPPTLKAASFCKSSQTRRKLGSLSD